LAEDSRAERVEGLVEAAAPLGIQLFDPHKLSGSWFSAGIFLAILEIQFPFFVEFWLLPLKYTELFNVVVHAFQL
jgi:hypothetical protein